MRLRREIVKKGFGEFEGASRMIPSVPLGTRGNRKEERVCTAHRGAERQRQRQRQRQRDKLQRER